jgi:plastocyanin
MQVRNFRALFAFAAVTMAMVGGVTLFLGQTTQAAQSDAPYVIEVSELGFNPAVCNISRADSVVWKNVGKAVHDIAVPQAGSLPPIDITGDIAPGETSKTAYSPQAGGNFPYFDAHDPSLTGVIHTPQNSNTGLVDCSAAPPTPTATATRPPTQAPTATATPSPTPELLAGCNARRLGAAPGNECCALAGGLAADSASGKK